MPARHFVQTPDRRLSLPASPSDAFGPSLKALADDVRDTLLAANAIGLTAPHIGVRERIIRLAGVRFGYRDGPTHEAVADGFQAAVVKHEIDQLDGTFRIDRLS